MNSIKLANPPISSDIIFYHDDERDTLVRLRKYNDNKNIQKNLNGVIFK